MIKQNGASNHITSTGRSSACVRNQLPYFKVKQESPMGILTGRCDPPNPQVNK